MYYYALYGYLAYKICDYTNVIELTLCTGKLIRYAYRWLHPSISENSSQLNSVYLDWVLVTENTPQKLKEE